MPAPKSAAEFGRFFLPICWVSEFRHFVLPICGVSVIWPIRSTDLLGSLRILGHLIGRCHSEMCIISFGTLDNTLGSGGGGGDTPTQLAGHLRCAFMGESFSSGPLCGPNSSHCYFSQPHVTEAHPPPQNLLGAPLSLATGLLCTLHARMHAFGPTQVHTPGLAGYAAAMGDHGPLPRPWPRTPWQPGTMRAAVCPLFHPDGAHSLSLLDAATMADHGPHVGLPIPGAAAKAVHDGGGGHVAIVCCSHLQLAAPLVDRHSLPFP